MSYIVLVPDLNAPSCRYRFQQYRESFQKMDISLEVEELQPAGKKRRRQLEGCQSYDTVVVHRKLLNYWDYHHLRRHCRRLVFDFDDAIMYRDSENGEFESRLRQKKFSRLAAGADMVVAGNKYLANKVRCWNSKVSIIPTPVKLTKNDNLLVSSSESGVIGWIGTSSNFKYLESLLPVLKRIFDRGSGQQLFVVADRRPNLGDLPFDFSSWSKETEIQALSKFSLGVMPLFDDPWARGKCSFKILKYFSVSIPAVASPVGMNNEVIQPGINGYLPKNEDQWVKALEDLLYDSKKRGEMGRAGRRLVEEKYSLKVNLPKLVRVLKGDP